MTGRNRYRIALFARNEERHLAGALTGLLDACPKPCDLRVHVLVNGCTDRTLDIATRFAAARPEVVVVELPFGDKSHAWNTYVYEIADDSPCHFFADGDVTCSAGSLQLMQERLLDNDAARAIAGLPLSGRHRERYGRYIKDWHWLFGNLYAIKHVQLKAIRDAGVRLPVGLYGNDHFISKFAAAASFRPTQLAWPQNIYRDDAGYQFRALHPLRWQDWRTYIRRRVTYTIRQLQIPELDFVELTDLPETMDAVNEIILARLNATPTLRNPLLRAARHRLRTMHEGNQPSWADKLHRAALSSTSFRGVSPCPPPRDT